jgi:hypothetical protein
MAVGCLPAGWRDLRAGRLAPPGTLASAAFAGLGSSPRSLVTIALPRKAVACGPFAIDEGRLARSSSRPQGLAST